MTETRAKLTSPYTVKSTDQLFVEATQDGVVRLLSKETPAYFQGLYTDGLETCFGIVIVGEKGITLIHSTNALSSASIADEFKRLGRIVFWTMAINPDFYPELSESEDLQLKLARIAPAIEAVAKKTFLKNADGSIKLCIAEKGFVSVDRKGKIDVTTKPKLTINPLDPRRRFAINAVNNVFLGPEEETPADIQFDGIHFQGLPVFHKTADQIKKLFNDKVSETSEQALRIYKNFCHFLPDKNTQAIDLKACPLMLTNYETPQCIKVRSTVCDKQTRTLVVCDAKAAQEHKEKPGFFNEKSLHQKDSAKLLEKYGLTDDSLKSLNKGLRAAAQNNQLDDIGDFIELGCNVDAQDDNAKKQYTALHIAALKDHLELARMLLNNKADMDICDAQGCTAVDYAHTNEMLMMFDKERLRYGFAFC